MGCHRSSPPRCLDRTSWVCTEQPQASRKLRNPVRRMPSVSVGEKHRLPKSFNPRSDRQVFLKRGRRTMARAGLTPASNRNKHGPRFSIDEFGCGGVAAGSKCQFCRHPCRETEPDRQMSCKTNISGIAATADETADQSSWVEEHPVVGDLPAARGNAV